MALAVLVETTWIVENLRSVGGGGLFHLAFNLKQTADAVQTALSEPEALQLLPVDIYKLTENNRAVLVADGHLAEIVRINSTLRLHIRLIHVCPFVTQREILWPDADIKVMFK